MVHRLVGVFLGVFLCAVPLADAQIVLPPTAQPLLLRLDPANPEPASVVHVDVRSLSFDLSKTIITWYVNGTLFVQGDNLTDIDVTLGNDSATHILVFAEKDDAILGSAEAYVRPAEVDIVWESNAYVPPFYNGRQLASPNSTITLETYARLNDEEGNPLPPQNIMYTWRRNNALIQSQSGRGKSKAFFPAPLLFGHDTISVEVTSLDETVSASAVVTIPSVDPFVVLYQEHPLFGTMYHEAVPRDALLPDVEVTFAAIPYFATEILGPSDPLLTYIWYVNQHRVTPSEREPNRLTINAENSEGQAHVEIEITHKTNYYLDARAAWDIAFNRIPGDAFLPTQ